MYQQRRDVPTETRCINRDAMYQQRRDVSTETRCINRDAMYQQRRDVSTETRCIKRDAMNRVSTLGLASLLLSALDQIELAFLRLGF